MELPEEPLHGRMGHGLFNAIVPGGYILHKDLIDFLMLLSVAFPRFYCYIV